MSLCVHEKLKKHSTYLTQHNGHISHNPARDDDTDILPYVGNGYFGLAFDPHPTNPVKAMTDEILTLRIRGQRTLSVTASYKPFVEVKTSYTFGFGKINSAKNITLNAYTVNIN